MLVIEEAPDWDASGHLLGLWRAAYRFEFGERVRSLVQAANVVSCGVDVWGSG